MKKRWSVLGLVLIAACSISIPVKTERVFAEQVKIASRANTASDSTLVSNVLEGELLDATIEAYNLQFQKQKTSSDFTYKDLRSISSTLDLSSYNIESIPENAFSSCSFKEVILPDSLKYIESSAFSKCEQLVKINLPESLITLGENAFNSCKSLETISDTNALPSKLQNVGNNVFTFDESLKSIILKTDGVRTDVYKNATGLFYSCTNLQTIVIDDGVSIIPASAFVGAGTAKESDGVSVTFGKNVSQILSNAFDGVKFKKNTELDFSECNALAGFSSGAFQKSQNLKGIILPKQTSNKGGVEFGETAFALTELSTLMVQGVSEEGVIYIPDYVVGLGKACFYSNEKMTAVSLSPKLSVLADNLFDYCTALESVEQRVSEDGSCEIQEIGDCAFRATAIKDTKFLLNMNQLTTIGYQHIEDSEYSMKSGVYDGSGTKLSQELAIESLPIGGITKVKVDSETKQKTYDGTIVGSEVFSDCYSLEKVVIPGSVTSIGSRAFYFYPRQITDTINHSGKKPAIQSIEWKSDKTGKDRIVWAGAFQGNSNLISVVLPYTKNDTLDIRAYSFAWDKELSNIGYERSNTNELPLSIINLSKGVFYRCYKLPSIVISDIEGKQEAPKLGNFLFEHCKAMTAATVPASIEEIPLHCFYDVPLTEFKVGVDNNGHKDKIKKIGNLAFLGNKFKVVDLSAYTGLSEIGAGAFAYWDSVAESGEGADSKIDIGTKSLGALTKVILPDKLDKTVNETGTLYLNTAPFYGQLFMTTLTTNAALSQYDVVKDGVFYVPDYITVGSARAIFGCTGVSKTIWQTDIDSNANTENRWTIIPMLLYKDCYNIKNATDVLPDGDYVEKIGKGAFYASSVETADLSKYSKLSVIGTGTLDKSEANYKGAFAECFFLKEVKLPQSTADSFILSAQTFYKKCNQTIDAENAEEKENIVDSLTSVDLGNVSIIRDEVFAGCMALEHISIPDSLTQISDNAFYNCIALQNVNFGKVTTIGSNAFENCFNLYLRKENDQNYGLPDTLESIDSSAFKNAGSKNTKGLGSIILGDKINSIGASAFESSGLNGADFSKAEALETISDRAFYNTNLKTFELSGTKVTILNAQVLSGCLSLTSVTLGDEVNSVKANAISGCPNFNTFNFAATTLVSKNVFNAKETINQKEYYTAKANGYRIKIQISVPSEPIIYPVDRTNVQLPYYIYGSGNSNLKHILIQSDVENNEDESVKEYLKVHAKLEDGYYWYKQEKGSKYVIDPNADSDYYEALSTSNTTLYNGSNVDVITMDTLKAGTFKFTIASAMIFNTQDEQQKTISTSFSTKYTIQIKDDMQFEAGIYREKEWKDDKYVFSDPLKSEENIQGLTNGDAGNLYLYYQMECEDSLKEWIDTYSIVVKTDNPQVVVPSSKNEAMEYSEEDGYIIKATNRNTQTNTITAVEANMNFWLVATGVGTANVTIYPRNHESWAKNYKVTVNSDIKSIKLNVPEEYRNGTQKGSSFNIFENYKNIYGEVVDATTIDRYNIASNRTITYETDYPEYVSVDNQGNVTILKADTKDKVVRITAVAQNTEETSTVSGYVDITIKGDPTVVEPEIPNNNNNQPSSGNNSTTNNNSSGNNNQTVSNTSQTTVRAGQTVEDAASGTTAKVSKVAENGTGGEVTITNITNVNVTKVTIPTTVTVNGVPYQVTAISDNLFSGFKKLSTVILSANITAIGNGAFQNCKKLKKIVIPKGVQSIGANAFAGCKNLKLITVKTTTLKSVGSNAFKGIHKKAKIKVPKKQYKTYKKLLSNKGQKKSVKIKK